MNIHKDRVKIVPDNIWVPIKSNITSEVKYTIYFSLRPACHNFTMRMIGEPVFWNIKTKFL